MGTAAAAECRAGRAGASAPRGLASPAGLPAAAVFTLVFSNLQIAGAGRTVVQPAGCRTLPHWAGSEASRRLWFGSRGAVPDYPRGAGHCPCGQATAWAGGCDRGLSGQRAKTHKARADGAITCRSLALWTCAYRAHTEPSTSFTPTTGSGHRRDGQGYTKLGWGGS